MSTGNTRIVGAAIVPRAGNVILDGEIEFSSSHGVIEYVGPRRGDLRPGDINGAGRLIIAGFTNGHTHSAMTLLRGYSDDVPLHIWLGHMRAFELRMTAQDMRAGLRLAMVEMLRSGTTSFIDMFHWDSTLLGAVSEAGMRVSAAPTVFGYDSVGFPLAYEQPGSVVVDQTPELAAEFAGDPLIHLTYGLHAPYTCSPELIADVAKRAKQRQLGVQIHLSETRREVEQSLAQHGVSPIRLVADRGLFDTELHIAHAVHPIEGDLELLARDNVSIAHNPVSNLKLGAGIAPVTQYRDANVTIALGTDSVASNNTLDLFEELKTGAILQRGLVGDPDALSGEEVFGWATEGGARAAKTGSTGRLEVGAQADLVMLDITGTTATPLHNPESFLYYTARGTDVTDVFVAGRQVVRAGVVTTMDEAQVRADVRHRVERITGELAAAGAAVGVPVG